MHSIGARCRSRRSRREPMKADAPDISEVAFNDDEISHRIRVDTTDLGQFGQGTISIKPLAIADAIIIGAASIHPAMNDSGRIHIPDAITGVVLANEITTVGNEPNGPRQNQSSLQGRKTFPAAGLVPIASNGNQVGIGVHAIDSIGIAVGNVQVAGAFIAENITDVEEVGTDDAKAAAWGPFVQSGDIGPDSRTGTTVDQRLIALHPESPAISH